MRFTLPIPPQVLGSIDEEVRGGLDSFINPLTVDVDVSGIQEIKANVHRLNQDMIRAAHEESKRAAEWLYRESYDQCPYKDGFLRGTLKMAEDDSDELTGYTVGYDASIIPYAWYVHEVPAAQYTTPGTKDHYLSDPAEELKNEFPDQMRVGIMRAIKGSSAVKSAGGAIPSLLPLSSGGATTVNGPRLVKKAKS